MLLHSLPNVVFFSTSDRTCTDVREEEKTKYWFPIKFWPAAVSDVTQPPSSADTVWAGPACITRASEIFFSPDQIHLWHRLDQPELEWMIIGRMISS